MANRLLLLLKLRQPIVINTIYVNTKPMEEPPHSSNSSTWANVTATVTKPPDATLGEVNEENVWKQVENRNGNKNRRNWRQKANILRGTAKCEF